MLPLSRIAQPDEVSCGPTCLASVLAGYGDPRPLPELLARVGRNPDGGTQAVYLGLLALELGYHVRLHPFGVRVFDPTWWELEPDAIVDRLARREAALAARGASDLDRATVGAWRELLARGGQVAFHEPSPRLLVQILARDRPLICGLNASWLYREARARPDDNVTDDIGGEPVGHFVVVRGYTGRGLHFHVLDPADDIPARLHPGPPETRVHGEYPLPAERLIHAILLGDTTRDAVLIEIWPAASPRS